MRLMPCFRSSRPRTGACSVGAIAGSCFASPGGAAVLRMPKLFRLRDRWVLVTSPFGPVRYFAGSFDPNGRDLSRSTKARSTIASSTMRVRTLSMARATPGSWVAYGLGTAGHDGVGWNGCMSLPRLLDLDADRRLIQVPAPQLAELRGERLRVWSFESSTGCVRSSASAVTRWRLPAPPAGQRGTRGAEGTLLVRGARRRRHRHRAATERHVRRSGRPFRCSVARGAGGRARRLPHLSRPGLRRSLRSGRESVREPQAFAKPGGRPAGIRIRRKGRGTGGAARRLADEPDLVNRSGGEWWAPWPGACARAPDGHVRNRVDEEVL